MAVVAVTLTGDRPEAAALCIRYMQRQTRQPDEWLWIDDGSAVMFPTADIVRYIPLMIPARTPQESFIRNMRYAIDYTQPEDTLIFIEDDDWYAPTYIEETLAALEPGMPGAGEWVKSFYNVAGGFQIERHFQQWYAQGKRGWRHAPLCATIVAPKGRADLEASVAKCEEKGQYAIDMLLWGRWRNRAALTDPPEPRVVGIKGMPGRPGLGSKHYASRSDPSMTIRLDPSGERLRQLIGDDAELYLPFRSKS